MTQFVQREKSAAGSREAEPLISVVIISYNNVHFLYHSVKSVLAQSYGNMELTISDDASVGCTLEDSARLVCLAAKDLMFEREHTQVEGVDRRWKKHRFADEQQAKKHREELEEWAADNFGSYQEKALELVRNHFPNIHRLEFKRNPENLGTVKHLKSLKKNAAGKYIMFLAADDKLHDPEVVQDMVDHFEQLPEDAYVLSSQCGMYDENLNQLYYYAVNEELKEIITASTPKELFAELTDWCIIPAAGTIYKKKVFDIYGDLDERYHLIEDWTYFLKLTRSGGKVYYYDRLTYMHRDGGISHGNNTGGSLAYRHYLEDCILLTRQEILPYLNQVTPKQKKRSLKHFRDTCREYGRKYQFPEMSLFQKLIFIVKYGDHYIPKLLYALLAYFEWRAKWCFLSGACALLLSYMLSLSPLDADSVLLYYAFGLTGSVLVFFSIFVKIAFQLIETVKNAKLAEWEKSD